MKVKWPTCTSLWLRWEMIQKYKNLDFFAVQNIKKNFGRDFCFTFYLYCSHQDRILICFVLSDLARNGEEFIV